ncbi:hypothetical protein [Desulfocastanea catecholica]
MPAILWAVISFIDNNCRANEQTYELHESDIISPEATTSAERTTPRHLTDKEMQPPPFDKLIPKENLNPNNPYAKYLTEAPVAESTPAKKQGKKENPFAEFLPNGVPLEPEAEERTVDKYIREIRGMWPRSNYWECLLEEMPGVKNDPAAIELMRKCKENYPISSYVEKKTPLFGVKKAGECVIKYGKDVSSPKGADAIKRACYKLYPR